MQQTSGTRNNTIGGKRSSVLMQFVAVIRVVAVDLAANLAARPQCAVDVDVSRTGTDGSDQLVDLTDIDTLSSGGRGGRDVRTNIGRNDGA